MTPGINDPIDDLSFAIAQLRHAYLNLLDPVGRPWDDAQRFEFANGLIAPQIERLERHAQQCRGTAEVPSPIPLSP